ncbi:internal scaffolding protein [Blackfly microvirus SF02]|uniref:Internal scaffolding protein n=1 Tax=Blackfly microvirus SF02 TaxID=2576452 RepID=A0A4P8PQD3_9VIRU|nr:internal scaffolding protein [Blackfly microvirus SF02]
MVKFRTRFDETYQKNKKVFWTDVGEDENLVQQHMAAECDVNTIMKRYENSGVLTHVQSQAAEFGDFYDVTDFKTGTERLMATQALFMELPASIRDRFNNDPAKFIDYATDEKNLEELRKMGLAEPLPPDPVVPITRKDLEEVMTPKAASKTPPA